MFTDQEILAMQKVKSDAQKLAQKIDLLVQRIEENLKAMEEKINLILEKNDMKVLQISGPFETKLFYNQYDEKKFIEEQINKYNNWLTTKKDNEFIIPSECVIGLVLSRANTKLHLQSSESKATMEAYIIYYGA